MTTTLAKMQSRRGTAAEGTSINPVLLAGEVGIETDTLKMKIGDGSTAWNSLPYFTAPTEYGVDPLPVGWGKDGTTPPAAAADYVGTGGTLEYRDFSDSVVQDLIVSWPFPNDIDITGDITAFVEFVVTDATALAADSVEFDITARFTGSGGGLDGTFGTTPVTSGVTVSGSVDQAGILQTEESSPVTASFGAPDSIGFFRVRRTSGGTYAFPVGATTLFIKYKRKANI